MERELNKIMIYALAQSQPIPADQWLETQPAQYHKLAVEAIYECMRKGWELHTMHIQSIARELDAKRFPKGW